MNLIVFIIIQAVTILVTFLVVFYCVKLLMAATSIQQRWWIAVNPATFPTAPENLSDVERELTGRVARSAGALGFSAVGNIHCPQFGWITKWTQALFLNRAAGERLSVIIHRRANLTLITVAFATEFQAGNTVVTDQMFEARVDRATPALEWKLDLVALHKKHSEAVQSHPDFSKPRIVPAEGKEGEWLQQRAALVARNVAEKRLGFAKVGDYYRPSFSYAVRQIWPLVWPIRPFTRLIRRLRGQKSARERFDVDPTFSSARSLLLPPHE